MLHIHDLREDCAAAATALAILEGPRVPWLDATVNLETPREG